jgi:hypothetical protein
MQKILDTKGVTLLTQLGSPTSLNVQSLEDKEVKTLE